jgi:hypothetical protein
MGQGQSFCWECGRFNHHHPRCKNNTNINIPTAPLPGADLPPAVEPDPKKQRCIRTCLTVWVAVLGSIGLLGIILGIFFALQIQNTFNVQQRASLQQVAAACGGIGAAFAIICIIISITWCSISCCCKKRWICACCGRQ